MKNKGNFCFCSTWGEFAGLDKDRWLEEMAVNFSLVCDEPEPGGAQLRAWLDLRRTLLKTLKQLPDAYKEVWLVFEYLLPMHKPGTKKAETEKGIRPDVLAVGRDFVIVFEFKQRRRERDGSLFKGYAAQAQKYVTRLNRYHAAARDVYVAPLVVLTRDSRLLLDSDGGTVCSSDRLAEALELLAGPAPEPLSVKEMESWLTALEY